MTAGVLARNVCGWGLILFITAGPVRSARQDEAQTLFGKFHGTENAHGAPQAESNDGVRTVPIVRLAGANGHDSVGGLMPLPLWPSPGTLRTPAPAKSPHSLGDVRRPARLRR
jgi:hypothetical protein